MNLSCVIYTSCEPCPMCLGAIYWAGIDRIYYANTRQDAEAIKFADSFIYEERFLFLCTSIVCTSVKRSGHPQVGWNLLCGKCLVINVLKNGRCRTLH